MLHWQEHPPSQTAQHQAVSLNRVQMLGVQNSTPSARPLSLTQLGHDSLHLVAVELHRHYELQSFSSVCQDFRAISIPPLFRCCYCKWNQRDKSVALPPPSLWPYVQSLRCVRGDYVGVTVNSLRKYLHQFPYLCTVAFVRIFGGVPWNLLQAFFHPSIHSIRFERSSWVGPIPAYPHSRPPAPGLDWPPIDENAAVADMPLTITEFIYTDREWRQVPVDELQWKYRGVNRLRAVPYVQEAGYLRPLVVHIHTTVQTLVLPAESAPFGAMARVHWPQLRVLRLWGRYPPTEELANIIPALDMMPLLRDLELVAGHPKDNERVLLWSESTARSPCFAELRTFKLSYPNPRDVIFRHLPPTLRHLSLRDQPRHYHFQPLSVITLFELSSPIPLCSELLQTLSQCQCDELDSLEVVYRADDKERELLAYIASAFPRLTTLEVHRYEERLMNMVDLARILSPLQHLHTIRFRFEGEVYRGPYRYDTKTSRWVPKDMTPGMFPAIANDFIRALISPIGPPNIKIISVLHLLNTVANVSWERWRVIKSPDGGREVELLSLGEQDSSPRPVWSPEFLM